MRHHICLIVDIYDTTKQCCAGVRSTAVWANENHNTNSASGSTLVTGQRTDFLRVHGYVYYSPRPFFKVEQVEKYISLTNNELTTIIVHGGMATGHILLWVSSTKLCRKRMSSNGNDEKYVYCEAIRQPP